MDISSQRNGSQPWRKHAMRCGQYAVEEHRSVEELTYAPCAAREREARMSLFLLALFVWLGVMMWAIIVFFITGRGTPPLNDVSPLPFGRKLLGLAAFVILALILIPMPEGLHSPDAQDMRRPYV